MSVAPLDAGDGVLVGALTPPFHLDSDDLGGELNNTTALPARLEVEGEEHKLVIVQEVVHR